MATSYLLEVSRRRAAGARAPKLINVRCAARQWRELPVRPRHGLLPQPAGNWRVSGHSDKGKHSCCRCPDKLFRLRMHPQVFVSHLHSDHIADLASLYIGAMFGRRRAWGVWGPSGSSPELGLAASIQGLRQVFWSWLGLVARCQAPGSLLGVQSFVVMPAASSSRPLMSARAVHGVGHGLASQDRPCGAL